MVNIEYRIIWAIAAIKRFYYHTFYGIEFGYDGSMLPKISKGKYISVIKKGAYIDIVNENNKKGEFIRMIPYQPNHGYMIEHWEDGRMHERTLMDFHFIKNHLLSGGESN